MQGSVDPLPVEGVEGAQTAEWRHHISCLSNSAERRAAETQTASLQSLS